MFEDHRPNVLFLFPDQWRWDWLGCASSAYGDPPVRTPNIDALAARGVRFTGCRTNSPVCSPARACLAQGLRYHRCQVASNHDCTPTDTPTVFRQLREAGYHTATCGKSDLFKPDKTPTTTGWLPIMEQYGFSDGIDHRGKADAVNRGRQGVDEAYTVMLRERGLLQLHLDDHPGAALNRAAYPTPLPTEAYTDDFCGHNALKLLERAPGDKPWCLWVNFPGPHDPYDPPAEALAGYEDAVFPPAVNPTPDPPAHRNPPRDRLHYAGCCTNIDKWVGRLLDAVEQRGELDRTLVVFASDHGEMLGDHGRWAKSVPHDPSVRVPLIIAGPGVPQRRVCDRPVELIDAAATVLDLTHTPSPTDWDSRSLTPLLHDPDAEHRDVTVSQLKNWRSVFDGRWKLIDNRDRGVSLFDMQSDPCELHDVAAAHADVVARLSRLLDAHNPWHPAAQAAGS